ncbi:MAG TPA: tetratricopeptide repeat protein [Opitutaceae bacterium]
MAFGISASAQGTDAPAPTHANLPAATEATAPAVPVPAPTEAERASLLRLGAAKLEQGDSEAAEMAFRQVLTSTDNADEIQTSLLGLARAYRKHEDLVKAAACYERFLKDFPEADAVPEAFLELGRTLRALGANKLAIARFYSVLHSTLKLGSEGTERYRQLARTAQFEIAETHFITGDYGEAARFFTRLNLLDLVPEDRARAQFKAAHARLLNGEHEVAAAAFAAFIEQHPDDPGNAEARYQLATLYQRLGRKPESLAATLELLRHEARTSTDPKRWAYWQRRTGNQLANEFYNQGDYTSSLTLYGRLAELSEEPRWRLPVLYQVALCQERLLQTDAARATYREILAALAPAQPAPPAAELGDLARMVSWRLGHLEWSNDTERRLDALTHPGADGTPAASESQVSS